MELCDRIAPAVAVHPGQVAGGSAGRDQSLARSERTNARLAQRGADVLLQHGDLRRFGWVAGEPLIVDQQGAQRQAPGATEAALLEVGDLKAAAAQIDQGAVLDVHAVDGAQVPEFRFAFAIDDLDLQPGFGLDALRQLLGHRGVAHGVGSQRGGGLGAGPASH